MSQSAAQIDQRSLAANPACFEGHVWSQLERCSSECERVAQTGEGERSARLVLHDTFGSQSVAQTDRRRLAVNLAGFEEHA